MSDRAIARLLLTAALTISSTAVAQPGNTAPQPTAPAQKAKLSPRTAQMVAAFDRISAVRAQLADKAKAVTADQIHLAILLDADQKISADERAVLSATGQVVEDNGPSNARLLALRAQLDDGTPLWIELELRGAVDHGQVASKTAPPQQETVRIRIAGDAKAPSSHQARLRVAWLWRLLGEDVDVARQPATLDAIVLGTQLVKTRAPANFEQPGKGGWLLLKTIHPDELYLAIDLEAGRVELFPKTPQQPTAAGRALFRAL